MAAEPRPPSAALLKLFSFFNPPDGPPALVALSSRYQYFSSLRLPRSVLSEKIQAGLPYMATIGSFALLFALGHRRECFQRGLPSVERVRERLYSGGANRFQLLAPRAQNEVDVVSHFAPLPL